MDGVPAALVGIAALLLLTCFVKIFTALNILRIGAGLGGNGFGIIVLSVTLALTLLVMAPQFDRIGGFDGLLKGKSLNELDATFRPFLERNSDPKVTERVSKIARQVGAQEGAPRFEALIVSFLVTELSEAFQLALLLLVPFLVIDLLIVNVMMLLNVTQLPATLISLPLKLFVFFAINGWSAVTEKLLQGYL